MYIKICISIEYKLAEPVFTYYEDKEKRLPAFIV